MATAVTALLARAGRPAHKPIVTAATLPATGQAPSQDLITRAPGSLGIAGTGRWLWDGRALAFPSPVRQDAPGWRAGVEPPCGCAAAQVIERREPLAFGLRRPPGAVWPEPVTPERAARLELRGRTPGRRHVPAGTVAAGCSGPSHGRARQPPAACSPAALDPLAEMRVHELKGSGDLDPLERIAHRFVSGADDESIGYAAESLRLLRPK